MRLTRLTRPLIAAVVLTASLLVAGGGGTAHAAPEEPGWTYHPRSAGATMGGKHILWANGSTTATVPSPGASRYLRFAFGSDVCGDAARVEVRVDGVLVRTLEILGDGEDFVVGDWAAGEHHVSFRFVNDLLTERCDRNVKLWDVEFLGADRYVYSYRALHYSTVSISPVTAGRAPVHDSYLFPGVLWNEGTLRGVVHTSDADERFSIGTTIVPCGDELPRLVVRIGGEVVADAYVDDDSGVFVYHDFGEGAQVVEMEYVNDFNDATCDRSVRIDSLHVHGAARPTDVG